MGLFDHFPYTNVHELNLDWVLSMMKALEAEWEAFAAGNSLTFADPMLHDISKTYAKNTIVLDGNGNAYVSLQAVPVGVGLQNGDYWLMVFDYEAFIEKVNKNFTANYYRGSYRATAAMAIGDWLTVDDVLYKATAAIAVDDVLEDGVNITHFTLEDFIKAFMTSANQMIQQYKNDIDVSEQLFTDNLTTLFNQAVAGVTVDSEILLARIGWNGQIYPTLADSIQEQIRRLHYMSEFKSSFFKGEYPWFNDDEVVFDKYYNNGNDLEVKDNNSRTSAILNYGIKVIANHTYKYEHIYLYFSPLVYEDGSVNFLTTSTSSDMSGTFTPVQDGYFYITLAANNGNLVHGNSAFGEVGSIDYTLAAARRFPLADIRINDQLYIGNSIDVTKIKNLSSMQYIDPDTVLSNHDAYYEMTVDGCIKIVVAAAAHSDILKPIELEAGVTYRFAKLYAYFSIFAGDDGTLSRLSATTGTQEYGTFTPSQHGLVYLTISENAVHPMFTDNVLPVVYKKGAYSNDNQIYTCEKGGTGDFDNLVAAITYATVGNNNTLYVGAGDWDLVQDFTAVYGPNTFDEDDPDEYPRDMILKNGVHVIFSQNANVHYEFTPTTEYYGRTFTPFRSGAGGFTLEGLNLSVTGARYCIHDERAAYTDQYNNIYKNCNFYLDNTQNTWGYRQCIGGGLGTNGNIIVENCTFESEGHPNQDIVSWHNTSAANARSEIVIKDCYFKNGTIRFSWYGNSQDISTMIITNCNLRKPIIHTAETVDAPYQNTEVIEWNNIVRNP